MFKPTKLTSVGTGLILSVLLSGCFHNGKCIKAAGLTPIASTQQFTIDNVVFRATIYPDGNLGVISVEDYTQPTPDGNNEIVISDSSSGGDYARIEFPPAVFAGGVNDLIITGFTYHPGYAIEAYDQAGNNLGGVQYTTQQGIVQILNVPGENIVRADFIGAEIGLTKVCYRSN